MLRGFRGKEFLTLRPWASQRGPQQQHACFRGQNFPLSPSRHFQTSRQLRRAQWRLHPSWTASISTRGSNHHHHRAEFQTRSFLTSIRPSPIRLSNSNSSSSSSSSHSPGNPRKKDPAAGARDWSGRDPEERRRITRKGLLILGGCIVYVIGVTQVIDYFKTRGSIQNKDVDQTVSDKIKPIVFLDFALPPPPGKEAQEPPLRLGRVFIELEDRITPNTAENFRALCTGEIGIGYQGSGIHLVDEIGIHGGLVNVPDASGKIRPRAVSIYGEPFEDENFELPHDEPYLVATERSQKDSNTSRFVITPRPAPELDGKSVVFGRVVRGKAVVQKIIRQKQKLQKAERIRAEDFKQRVIAESAAQQHPERQVEAAESGFWSGIWDWATGGESERLLEDLEEHLHLEKEYDQLLQAAAAETDAPASDVSSSSSSSSSSLTQSSLSGAEDLETPVAIVIRCGELDLSGQTDFTDWDLDDPNLPALDPKIASPRKKVMFA